HVFFVFSSRRRHTRSTRDWSSDVCSSDLFNVLCIDWNRVYLVCKTSVGLDSGNIGVYQHALDLFLGQRLETLRTGVVEFAASLRSEERRVGKECRVHMLRSAEERNQIKNV